MPRIARRRRLLAVLAPAVVLFAAATPAAAHEGDPHYRSVVDQIVPATDGLSATVLDHDDALQLVNRSGKDVVVLDEDGEPYARLLADATVQVNARSSMTRGENAPPHSARTAWVTVNRTGRFQWHDPRINYRERPVPPQVTDEAKETKVKDWRVPLLVAGQAGDVLGTLTWVGEPGAGSSFPTAALVSIVALALLAVAAVVLVRRRRVAGGAAT
jgi:hypothetical protein